jgi:galactose oxidase-like protein
MMVWGGIDNSGAYLDGDGRYCPATDTWTTLPTMRAPSPRSGHSAVWTGAVMVVWGGERNSTFLDTGARYDPVANSWDSTAKGKAPSARFQQRPCGPEAEWWSGAEALRTGL